MLKQAMMSRKQVAWDPFVTASIFLCAFAPNLPGQDATPMQRRLDLSASHNAEIRSRFIDRNRLAAAWQPLLSEPIEFAAGVPAPVESTGFEAADGWAEGFVCGPTFATCTNSSENCDIGNPNPDTGWYLSATAESCVEPHIETINAFAGTQHLRFTQDPALCVGFGVSCRQTAFTPEIAVPPVGPTTVTFQVAVSDSGARYWAFSGQVVLAWIEFHSGGNVEVFDVFHGGLTDTGVPVAAAGAYQEVRIEIDPCGNRVDYHYGDVLVFSGRHSGLAAAMTRGVFLGNNGTGDIDFDDYAVVRGAACPAGVCGNNITEIGETCDGKDDIACGASICNASCVCVPIGACCDSGLGTCTDDALESDCIGASKTFDRNQTCCEVDCLPSGVEFDASGVTLLSHVPLGAFSASPAFGNEVWGYVSPSGREYAIFGIECAFAFIEVTDPINPVIVAEITGPCSPWRDTSVFGEFVYGVIDHTGDGLYVMDVSQIDSGIVRLVNKSTVGGFNTAHNIDVNQDTGFAYAVATNIGVGIVALDLSDPVNPTIAGSWNDDEVHDVQVVSLPGGQEIAFSAGLGTGMIVVDVTDKAAMFTRSVVSYPNLSIPHQGWISEDFRYLFFGDEGDEFGGLTTTTYVMDISDLDNATLANTFSNGKCAIDHNMMVRGDNLYQANYTTGLRIFDVSDILNVTETGFFDTFPANSATTFAGAWGVYARFPSGNVLIGDFSSGLFVLDVSAASLGSCCHTSDEVCADHITLANCADADAIWTLGGRCVDGTCEFGVCSCDTDVNGGDLSVLDVQTVFDCVTMGLCDGCTTSCDVNCDGSIDFIDIGVVDCAFQGLSDCCNQPVGACIGGPAGEDQCAVTLETFCASGIGGSGTGVYLGDGKGCFIIEPPDPPLAGQSFDRTLAVVLTAATAGSLTAYRVTLVTLYNPDDPQPQPPQDFSANEGKLRYLNLLLDRDGNVVTDCVNAAASSTTYPCITTGCEPEFADWGTLFGDRTAYVSGNAIIPDSTYTIAHLAASCTVANAATCTAASAEVAFTTARYGDVQPDGLVTVGDVVLTVDAVKQLFGSVFEYQVDIADQNPIPQFSGVGVRDIVAHVDALKLFAYQLPIISCP